MTTPAAANPFHWPAFASAAVRLRASRAASDPAFADRQALTPAQADSRARVAEALVLIWTGLAGGRGVPDFLPAGVAEIRADLAVAAPAAARIAAATPADPAMAQYAAILAEIARACAPREPGSLSSTLSILITCNRHNQIARARREAGNAARNEGGHHVESSAARAHSDSNTGRGAPSPSPRPHVQAGLL